MVPGRFDSIMQGGYPPPPSYEAALLAAWVWQKMMETAATLQSDLNRLNSKPRGRSQVTHSQSSALLQDVAWQPAKEASSGVNVGPSFTTAGGKSGNVPKPWPLAKHITKMRGPILLIIPKAFHIDGWVSTCLRARTWLHIDGWVSTCLKIHQLEPPVVSTHCWGFGNLARTPGRTIRDPYLVERAGGHPWQGEDPQKFARKIQGLFLHSRSLDPGWTQVSHFPHLWPQEGLSTGELSFPKDWNIRMSDNRPILLTMAYCWCLQHWAEKPWPANKCRSLSPGTKWWGNWSKQSMNFMHITARDLSEGMDMDQPMKAVQPPFATLFGHWF